MFVHTNADTAVNGVLCVEINNYTEISLLDNAPNYIVGCVIQKRTTCWIWIDPILERIQNLVIKIEKKYVKKKNQKLEFSINN